MTILLLYLVAYCCALCLCYILSAVPIVLSELKELATLFANRGDAGALSSKVIVPVTPAHTVPTAQINSPSTVELKDCSVESSGTSSAEFEVNCII